MGDPAALAARRTEAACAARGLVQGSNLDEGRLLMAGDHHLGDAFAAADHERLLSMIDQDDPDLAAIVAVDRAG